MRLAPALLALGFIAHASQAHAQSIASLPDHAHALKIHETVQPHAEAPFGEQINLYTGAVAFRHQDVLLEGIGPALRLVRENTTLPSPGLPVPAFGDWQLSVPRIETFADASLDGRPQDPGERWVVAPPGHADRYKRCSRIGESFAPELLTQRWWFGIELITDTGERQQVLRRSAQNTAKPTGAIAGASTEWPAVTSAQWQLTCLATTRNGQAGEAFLAVSPDGTRYWFDHLVGEPAATLTENTQGAILRQRRMLGKLLVSRIEDRFGNAVHYTYDDGRLVSLAATDGRKVRIDWRTDQPLVDAIVLQPDDAQARTWRYTYAPYTSHVGDVYQVLGSVQRPDGTQWAFDLHQPSYVGGVDTSKCGLRGGLPADARRTTRTITNPQGLIGQFVFAPTWHAHSYVLGSCVTHMPETDPYEEKSPLYMTASLVQRVVSGPAVSPQTWNYAYAPAEGSVSYDACAQTGTCVATKWVDIVDPAGHRSRYVHANVEGATDGQLLRIERYQGHGTLLQSEAFEYATFDAGPWPAITGDAMAPMATRALRQTPLRTRSIERQGVTFTSRVDVFDTFARPIRTTRASSLGFSRIDVTDYADHAHLWVMGQVRRAYTVDGATSAVSAETQFDADTALPDRSYAFGELQRTSTWHPDGTLASASDGRDTATFDTTLRYADWKRGLPQTITHPDGTVQTAVVDDFGQVRATIDEAGARTCYDYDLAGRLTKTTWPSESQPGVCDASAWNLTTASFVRASQAMLGIPAGHWQKTVQTGNGVRRAYFDALWRPVLEETYDAANIAGTASRIVTRHDADGHVVFRSPALRSVENVAQIVAGTRTTHDALGRVTRVEEDAESGVLATQYAYGDGFQTRIIDPRGNVTYHGYHAWDDPAETRLQWSLLPEGTVIEIPKDAFGKPTLVQQRNGDGTVALQRRYVYDGAHRLCKTIEPETGSTVMGYDGAGNPSWQAAGLDLPSLTCDHGVAWNSGRAVLRNFDQRNRLLSLVFPDGRGTQTWVYAPNGLPTRITTDNAPGAEQVINSYAWNARGLRTGDAVTQPGRYTWTVGTTHDRNGHADTRSYPNGTVVALAPDALGRPTRAGNYAYDARHHPNGALQSFTYGNGITHTVEQNVRGLPERRRDVHGGTPVFDESYDYDANGNLAAISDGLSGARSDRTMAYDGQDRLVRVDSPMFGTAAYAYDALDNLASVSIGGTNARVHHFCHDAHWRLTNVKVGGCGGASVVGLGYDAQGNVANRNGQAYDFDYGNRLRVAAGIESYRYDGHGRRVQATSLQGKGDIVSQYDADGRLMWQHDGRDGQGKVYLHLADRLVAIREQPHTGGAATVKYQHTDLLGSPVAVTDPARTVLQRSEYEPYGAVLNRPAQDGVGYTGHVSDAQTGLVYMQQRYYDEEIGRFLSVDPIEANSLTGEGFNRYAYALNSPYRFVDPDGRFAIAAPAVPLLLGAAAFLTYMAGNTPEKREEHARQLEAQLQRLFSFNESDAGNDADGRTPAPFLPSDPYSPEETSRRQTGNRESEGAPNLDPDSAIPDRGAGSDQGGHETRGRTPHDTGERNVNSKEEHSRRPKGNPSGRAR